MGRCCLYGYGAQGEIWSNPDTWKANVPVHMSYYSAALPGCWKAGKRGQMSCLPSGATNLACGTQGRGFNSWEDGFCFSCLQACDWLNDVPILMPVVYKLCKLWQILHDQALKFVAEFSLLFDFGTLPFRNIAHGKKRSYIKNRVMVNYLPYLLESFPTAGQPSFSNTWIHTFGEYSFKVHLVHIHRVILRIVLKD